MALVSDSNDSALIDDNFQYLGDNKCILCSLGCKPVGKAYISWSSRSC